VKKKLLILICRDFTKNSFKRFGISFFNKNYNTKIINIFNLSEKKKCSNLKIKKIIKKFNARVYLDLVDNEKYDYIKIYLDNLNIVRIDIKCLSGYPYTLKKNNFYWRVTKIFKTLLYPRIFFYKFFTILKNIKKSQFKPKNNLIIYGGLHSKFFPNTKNSKYKVYASCLDYYYCLKEYKNSFYKKYAVFVDAGISYHPDQKFDQNLVINRENYYESLYSFFNQFEIQSGLKIIIALHPRSKPSYFPKYFKKYKIIKNNTAKLIKYSELVFLHQSTALVMAIFFKKPLIYLTCNEIEKYKFIFNPCYESYLTNSKTINIDTFGEKNYKISIFYYFKKKIRSLYYKNFIKHPLSAKLPWYYELKSYLNNNDLL
jgi:hypothetical protein